MSRRKSELQVEENIFWITMTDLFLGMFLVFATLFFVFVMNSGRGSQNMIDATQNMAKEISQQMSKVNIKVKMIYEDRPELTNPADKANIEIDPVSGLIRISEIELFAFNSSELTPQGKAFLSKFIPIYFNTIYKEDLQQHISSVVIQGHTDSTNFKGNYSKEEQYLKNMNLSMNRAYNVADYIFKQCSNKPYQKDLIKTIKVEGASSSTPIMINGIEDKTRSRRVELRLLLKRPTDDILSRMFVKGAEYEDLR